VGRTRHAAVSLVLLCVLSGAPAVALICAEWCASAHETAQSLAGFVAEDASHAHHGGPAQEAVREEPVQDCHRAPGSGPTLAAEMAPECLDRLSSPALASLAQRADLTGMAVTTWTDVVRLEGPTRFAGGLMALAGPAAPPRPTPSSLVLRI
jgi:hypothetical protein